MFKTLAIASIAAMTMGRDLILEDSHFGDRQLKADKGPADISPGKVPQPMKDPFKPYFLKKIDKINGTKPKGMRVITSKRSTLEETADLGPIYCAVSYKDMLMSFDDQSGEIGSEMRPKSLDYEGRNVLDGGKCSGSVELKGDWKKAASRFGATLKWYQLGYDLDEDILYLENGKNPIDIEDVKVDEKLLEKIGANLDEEDPEIKVQLLEHRGLQQIVKVKCPPKYDDDADIEEPDE